MKLVKMSKTPIDMQILIEPVFDDHGHVSHELVMLCTVCDEMVFWGRGDRVNLNTLTALRHEHVCQPAPSFIDALVAHGIRPLND